MDDAAPPSAAGDGEPGVLGNLPTTRPQHRSARRREPASVAVTTSALPAETTTTTTAVTKAPGTPPRRRAAAKPAAAPPAAAAPKLRAVPDVPAPPPAPRSGWATPEPTDAPAALPPLVALADGAVRTGAQLLRGVLRRLPGG